MEYTFDWDEAKADSNKRKHGVTFDEGRTVFYDPLRVTIVDEEHSDEEQRLLTFGCSEKPRLLLVVHTEQEVVGDLVLVRIISCRKATRQEREEYEG